MSTVLQKKYLPTLKRLTKTPKYKKLGRYYLPYHSLTTDKDWGYKTCMQGFCDPTCSQYSFKKRSKKRQQEWYKSRKNGFHTSYTPEQISNYKKEGALSGCIEGHNMYNL